MTQTTNYQLNQWEATDQVQRVDFNADNAKIDAALGAKAEQSALAALTQTVNGKAAAADLTALTARVTALESKSRFTKLWEMTLTASSSSIIIPLSGVNWSQWDKVHLDMKTTNGSQMNLYFNEVDPYASRFPIPGGSDYFSSRITFYPGKRADRHVSASRTSQWTEMNGPYSSLTRLIISNDTMYAGAKFILWGEE